MKQPNYNIPKTKKEKAELLKAILKGEKTINNLQEPGYKIIMWMEDETDPGYLKTFDGSQRISKADYEEKKLTGLSTYVTLELD